MVVGVIDRTDADGPGQVTVGTTLRWSAGLSCTRVAAARPVAAQERPDQVAVVPLTGGLALLAVRGLAAALAEVFLSAFAAPPWNQTSCQARSLPDRMLADAGQPGFVLALARTHGGGLAGFGYGLPRCPAPGSGAHPLPFAEPRPFELCDLAVRPSAGGTGAWQALHDGILAASGPQPRWLVTPPAGRLYQASGWQVSRVLPGDAADGGGRILMTRPC